MNTLSTKLVAVEQKIEQLFALNMDSVNQIMARCESLIPNASFDWLNVKKMTKRDSSEYRMLF